MTIVASRSPVSANAEPLPDDIPGVDAGPPTGEQYIPEKYNEKTELEVTIDSGSDKITKDFQLEE